MDQALSFNRDATSEFIDSKDERVEVEPPATSKAVEALDPTKTIEEEEEEHEEEEIKLTDA